MLWWLAATAAAAPCDREPPSMVVVLWERRYPRREELQTEAGEVSFRTRQLQMRDDLVDLLDELDLEDGDYFSVLPEGLEEGSAVIDALQRSRSPARVHELLERALAGPGQAVSPVHLEWSVVGGADDLTMAITARVIDPMVRPTGESRPENQRSVSHPLVLVHHAMLAATGAHRADEDPCRAPGDVTLVLASTGLRDYIVTDTMARVTADYGIEALRYFGALYGEGAYRLTDRFPTRFERLTVYDVTIGELPAEADELRWQEAGAPAAIDATSRFERWPILDRPLARIPPPTRWAVPLGDLELYSASAVLGDATGSTPVPLASDGRGLTLASPAAFRDLLLEGRRGMFGSRAGSYTPELRTDLRAISRTTWSADLSDIPRVPQVRPLAVAPPSIVIALNPIPRRDVGIVAILLVTTIVGMVAWSRRRPLIVESHWSDDTPVDLAEIADRDEFARTLWLSVRDAVPFLRAFNMPRQVRITVRRRAFVQPEVPVIDPSEFVVLDGAGTRWRRRDDALTATLWNLGEHRDQPLTVRVRHRLVDHATIAERRLRTDAPSPDQRETEVLVQLEVSVSTRGFLPSHQRLYPTLRMFSVPGVPDPRQALQIRPGLAARYLPLFEGQRLSGSFGVVEVANPPRTTCVTLPIQVQMLHGRAVFVAESQAGEPHEGEVVVLDERRQVVEAWSRDLPCSRVERVPLAVTVPEEVRASGFRQWQVTVTIILGWTSHAAVDTQAMPPLRGRFRMQPSSLENLVGLDFGTSAIRLLIQDTHPEAWGFLPLSDFVEEPADLPSEVWVGPDRVVFHPHARDQDRDVGRYYDSIKERVVAGLASAAAEDLECIVAALLSGPYRERAVQQPPRVLQPGDANLRLLPDRARRSLVVVTVPNDAPPLYEASLRRGIAASGQFDGAPVLTLREAEAVALWYASRVFADPPRGLQLRDELSMLVVDYGAGTSDAALVRVRQGEGPSQRVDVISTGGARVGGRSMDAAIFDSMAQLQGHRVRWTELGAVQQQELRPRLEELKVAASRRQFAEQYVLRSELGGQPLRLAGQLARALQQDAYQEGLRAMSQEPLAVLVGRRQAGKQNLADVDLVVMTGRAAQTLGLQDMVRAFVQALAGRAVPVEIPDAAFLKASVSLGARRFARGLAPGFQPSSATFRDRVLYLGIDAARRAYAQLLVGAGRVSGGAEQQTVVELVPSASASAFVSTWLVPVDHEPEHSWQIGPRQIEAILADEYVWPLDGAPAPVRIDAPERLFARETAEGRRAEVRVTVGIDHSVTLEAVDA